MSSEERLYVDCDRAAELLPWYLNDSLEADDRRTLTDHLEACDACRAELRDAEAAFTLYGGHPPARLLVDYGFERPDAPRDLIEAHLADCDRCAAELALVRQSRVALRAEATTEEPSAAGAVVRFRGAQPGGGGWRLTALAASIIALVGLAGWFWSWRLLSGGELAELRSRSAELSRQVADDQEQIADLRQRIGELSSPQPNVPILDLWPDGAMAVRGQAAVDPGTDGDLVAATLILNTELSADTAVDRLELRDASDRLLSTVRDLHRDTETGFTLSLPLSELPEGLVQIRLYGDGDGAPLERYTLELR